MRNIVVLPYDSHWQVEFEKIKMELQNAVERDVVSIEHVGSTSVVGLWAKPIIDIDIVIKKDKFQAVKSQLESIGYFHVGDLGIESREAFHYHGKEHLMEHHLYVCKENSPELKRHISLRDYLRNHADDRDQYSTIKIEMAKKHPHDIEAYIEGKQPVILDIYKKSRIIINEEGKTMDQ